MSLTRMPETFRGAILTTRKLGIQYLCIDSRCIIQDDCGDWERDSAKMAGVYSNAYITIAASTADGDSRGFLDTRSISEIIYTRLTLKDGGESQLCFQLRQGNGPYRQPTGAPVNDEPLTGRAGVIRERWLSRGTVLFATDQTYWECQKSCVAENGYRALRTDTVWTD